MWMWATAFGEDTCHCLLTKVTATMQADLLAFHMETKFDMFKTTGSWQNPNKLINASNIEITV